MNLPPLRPRINSWAGVIVNHLTNGFAFITANKSAAVQPTNKFVGWGVVNPEPNGFALAPTNKFVGWGVVNPDPNGFAFTPANEFVGW